MIKRTPLQKGARPPLEREDREDEEDQGDLEDRGSQVGTPPHRLSLSPVSRAVRAEQGLEELRNQMDQMARDLEAQRRESNAKDRASEDQLLVIASLKKSLEEARLPSTGQDRAAGTATSPPSPEEIRAELRREILFKLQGSLQPFSCSALMLAANNCRRAHTLFDEVRKSRGALGRNPLPSEVDRVLRKRAALIPLEEEAEVLLELIHSYSSDCDAETIDSVTDILQSACDFRRMAIEVAAEVEDTLNEDASSSRSSRSREGLAPFCRGVLLIMPLLSCPRSKDSPKSNLEGMDAEGVGGEGGGLSASAGGGSRLP